MKNLKDYIKPYINESIWDVDNNVESDNNEFVIDEIKQFIKDNYQNVNLKCLDFVFDKEKNKYIVNYTREVSGIKLRNKAKSIVNDLFEWGLIDGWFDCSGCDNLNTLQGAPKKVEGDFYCHNCPKLESLQGAPEYVGGGFYCSSCPITSLQGAPKTVDGTFDCSYCEDLSSLEGAPKEVGENFYCQGCPNLHSLDGVGKVKGIIVNDIKNK